jgi:hypothetical protein
LTEKQDVLWKAHWERYDTIKGIPLAYMCIAKCIYVGREEERRPRRSRTSEVDNFFRENGYVMGEVIKDLQDSETPTIITGLIGKLVWMNNKIQNMFPLGENDLWETFIPRRGLEAYDKCCDHVFKTQPAKYEGDGISFQRMDDLNHRPCAYIVKFLDLDLKENTKSTVEQCDELLAQIGMSTTTLDEKYDKHNQIVGILDMEGNLLYRNSYFKTLLPRDESCSISRFVSFREYFDDLPNVLGDLFSIIHPEKYSYESKFYLKTVNRKVTCYHEYIRLNIHDDVAFGYLVFVTVNSPQWEDTISGFGGLKV